MGIFQKIRETFGHYECSFWWMSKDDVVSFTFSKECGDGCCGWNEYEYLPFNTEGFGDFFVKHPSGEIYWNGDEDVWCT